MSELNSRETTLSLLLSRRSVVAANIVHPGPDDEELKQIISAGVRVPDHGKICPWRIQILEDKGRRQLVQLQEELFPKVRPTDSRKKLELLMQVTMNSPRLLVVTSYPEPLKFEKIPLIEQQLSGGAVCQNILVAAHSMGYVAQWLTSWPAYQPEIKTLLGHSVDRDILGFIHIGSASLEPGERDRPDYDAVVSSWNGSQPGFMHDS